MAGLGRKVFEANEVLTAADVNGFLMDQSIMVFPNAASRDTVITTPSEGMTCYLQDTNEVLVFNGSSFVSVAPEVTSLNRTAIVTTVVTDASTARTITSADQGKIIRFTSGSAITVTVDGTTDFSAGQSVDIIQDGAGIITVTASTATVAGDAVSTTSGSFTIGTQFSAASILGLGSDTYRLIGNITAVA